MSCLKVAQQQCELIYLWQARRGQHFFHTFEKNLGGRKRTSRNCCIICTWVGIVSVCECVSMCVCVGVYVFYCVPRPVWGCWQCCEEWSYWAALSGSLTPAWTTGPGSFGPPQADWWRQDSLQWASGETTHQASNEAYCQEAASSSTNRMFGDW